MTPRFELGVEAEKSKFGIEQEVAGEGARRKRRDSSCIRRDSTRSNLESDQNQFHALVAVDQGCMESKQLDG